MVVVVVVVDAFGAGGSRFALEDAALGSATGMPTLADLQWCVAQPNVAGGCVVCLRSVPHLVCFCGCVAGACDSCWLRDGVHPAVRHHRRVDVSMSSSHLAKVMTPTVVMQVRWQLGCVVVRRSAVDERRTPLPNLL